MMDAISGPPSARPPGAFAHTTGTFFKVWAPKPGSVDLVLLNGDGCESVVRMNDVGEGYWTAEAPGAGPGQRYLFGIEGGRFPDPCSRSQPDGVHGPSEVVDASRFAWTDEGFVPPGRTELVIYECHIGTLTQEGTFDAAIDELGRLKALGVTAIEIMPVASFPGRWNWGYDGVDLFAPAAVYGGPEGLRRLIDAAHGQGLAVILDVVFNHFGPSGNYTAQFSDSYLTSAHDTPWGDAVNFDREGAEGVRRFVIENLLMWQSEYHMDGFRFDATHAIKDSSRLQILAEARVVLSAHKRGEFEPYLIAETHENDPRYLQAVKDGGFGFDAVWADDFHNVVQNILHTEREGYLRSFAGTTAELAHTVSQGFLFEGQFDEWLGESRGAPAREQPWRQFIYCLQNHDQVGNRALGERIQQTASEDDVRAATLLLLLLPQTPMLFQGEEYFARTPFLYFTDHEAELGRQVTEGRRDEFADFAAFRDPRLRDTIPDPQDENTFLRSKLQAAEREHSEGKAALRFHTELLRRRREDASLVAMRDGRPPIDAAGFGRALLVTMAPAAHERRLIAVNFGDSTAALKIQGGVRVMLHSREEQFGGDGCGPEITAAGVTLPPHCAALLTDA
jgi:maltooligosyltrehalose trehalohydrolase